jgi:hypothetical protein
MSKFISFVVINDAPNDFMEVINTTNLLQTLLEMNDESLSQLLTCFFVDHSNLYLVDNDSLCTCQVHRYLDYDEDNLEKALENNIPFSKYTKIGHMEVYFNDIPINIFDAEENFTEEEMDVINGPLEEFTNKEIIDNSLFLKCHGHKLELRIIYEIETDMLICPDELFLNEKWKECPVDRLY